MRQKCKASLALEFQSGRRVNSPHEARSIGIRSGLDPASCPSLLSHSPRSHHILDPKPKPQRGVGFDQARPDQTRPGYYTVLDYKLYNHMYICTT